MLIEMTAVIDLAVCFSKALWQTLVRGALLFGLAAFLVARDALP